MPPTLTGSYAKQKATQYSFFPNDHGRMETKTDYVPDHKTNFNKYKELKSYKVCSQPNGIYREISNKKRGKFSIVGNKQQAPKPGKHSNGSVDREH